MNPKYMILRLVFVVSFGIYLLSNVWVQYSRGIRIGVGSLYVILSAIHTVLMIKWLREKRVYHEGR